MTSSPSARASRSATKRALDPTLKVNSNFVRKGALLAIVFVTDEDDCSAANSSLYDPSQLATTGLLGPLSSFRCARFGYTCSPPIDSAGTKTACTPSGAWLHPVDGYVSFFKGLKPAGQVFLAAIAGPTSPISVGIDGKDLTLKPSCESGDGSATPALRIAAVLDGLGGSGIFNLGIDAKNQPVAVNICSSDYEPLFRLLALKLAGAV